MIRPSPGNEPMRYAFIRGARSVHKIIGRST